MSEGACASGDFHSARAGRDVLDAGGNAVDAAVAATLTASFTLPTMTGLGGGGIVTLRTPRGVRVLDAFADVPTRADRPAPEAVIVHFEGLPQTFRVGPSSAAVPGLVAGIWEAHRRCGRMPMREIVAPVARAARDGLPLGEGQHRAFRLLQAIYRRTPACWRLIGDGDDVVGTGATLTNPDLADLLERLAEEGPRGFYEGPVARSVEEVTEGLLPAADLARFRAVWRDPLAATYRDRRVWCPGAPSLSGALLLAALGHLAGGPPLVHPFDGPSWERVVASLKESERLRTADYERRLFEGGYLEGLTAGCTMQCSTVDAEGLAVSFTSTVGESAGIAIPGCGVALNNFLGEEDIHPPGRECPPGTRLRTSMCPVLLSDREGRWIALGSAGSTRIRSALLQVAAHVVDGGAGLQEAVRHPRVHVEAGVLYVEGHGRRPEEVDALRSLAPEVRVTTEPGFYFGGVQAAGRTSRGVEAGADEVRRGGAACRT